ncbi:MAG: capsular polysaccharide biosynthesis protein [Oscillospiraceae bacterium]|nr:capsular polysaccharide biosynthesis protein [Oscillospiraceae bacterium]
MNGMVDIHSHILPKMDDGSRSCEESIRMLAASAEQGVDVIAATSHFYPTENSPEEFLHRRRASYDRLCEAMKADGRAFPRIVLGAEVYYFEGISSAENVELLRIEGTPLLLLEMPFSPWTSRMVDEIKRLHERQGITVLMAHVERYERWQKEDVWDDLSEHGILMQHNAEHFLSWRTKRKALRHLHTGRVRFIGSDCHNMTSRPPRLGEAMRVIDPETLEALSAYARRWLPDDSDSTHDLQ